MREARHLFLGSEVTLEPILYLTFARQDGHIMLSIWYSYMLIQ